MKTILYALSIVVILTAAYFAYDTKQKIDTEIAAFDEVEKQSAQVKSDIKSTEKAQVEPEAALEEQKTLAAELAATVDSESSKTTGFRKSIQELDAEIQSADAELNGVEELRAEAAELVGEAGLEIDEIPDRIASLEEQLKVDRRNLETLTKREAKLNRDVAANKEEVEGLVSRLADLRQKIAQGSRSGVITAVDKRWGFVVVNQGSGNSSLTDHAELLVSRGGKVLGRVTVSSLEPNRAVCDINFDSFRPGVRVRSGDRVTLVAGTTN